jgi:hypothetical protein
MLPEQRYISQGQWYQEELQPSYADLAVVKDLSFMLAV